jgi:hypothetical protein
MYVPGGLGGELTGHGADIKFAECGRICDTISDGEKRDSSERLGDNALDKEAEDDGHHGLTSLDNVGKASSTLLEHGIDSTGVTSSIKHGDREELEKVSSRNFGKFANTKCPKGNGIDHAH